MKARRLLEVKQTVEARRRFTVQELADKFGVSYRTMWRDLQDLSGLGVPLYADPGVHGGYRLLDDAPPPAGRLVTFPALQLVGMNFTSPYTAFAEAAVLIPRLWMRLLERLPEIAHHQGPRVRYGVADNRADDFTYAVAVPVSAPGPVPDGMVSLSMPQRRCAAFTHRGAMERTRIDETYRQAFAWIKEQRLAIETHANWVERYGEQYDPQSAGNAFEIFLPVRPI